MLHRFRNSDYYRYWYNLQKKTHDLAGFTFIELIIVVTIIAILSASAWLSLSGETDKARDAKRLQDLAQIQQALEKYYLKNSFYPQPAIREDGEAVIVKGEDSNPEEKGFLAELSAAMWGDSAQAQSRVQKNAWGYKLGDALASCKVDFNEDTNSVIFENTYCGGDIRDQGGTVIGWKGTITEKAGKNTIAVAHGRSNEVVKPFGAEYIQNIGRDPKLGANPALAEVELDYYIYAVYRGRNAGSDLTNGATQYQLATTLEGDGPDDRSTYIIGNYTQKQGKLIDPYSLIGSGKDVLDHQQKIGQNNLKVTNKTANQKQTALRGILQDFTQQIDILLGRTASSSEAQDFLSQAKDLATTIDTAVQEEGISIEALDALELQLDDARESIKEGLNRFYSDAAINIAENIGSIIESDPSEGIKKTAIEKVTDVLEVYTEVKNFMRNNDNFTDLRSEFDARKQAVNRLDILLENVTTLSETLTEEGDVLEELIPADIQESLFSIDSNDALGIPLDEAGATNTETDTETIPTNTVASLAAPKTQKLIESIEKIKTDLFEVKQGEQKFSISYNRIILDIDSLQKNITDIKTEIENSSSILMSQSAFDQWFKNFTSEQSPINRLTLSLSLAANLKKETLKPIQVYFKENLLGSDTGESGVVKDIGPLSDYSGIPYPLEIGA